MSEQVEKKEVALKLEGVSFAYDDKPILSDISFEVYRGEMFFIVGDSGSGKTTLLRVCAGLLDATSGSVEVKVRKDAVSDTGVFIGFVFQQQGLISNMTVFDNVALPLRYHTDLDEEAIREKVEGALRSAGALETMRMRPDYLSLGMQRRVDVARAVVLRPDIVFYDDPTLGLDHVNAAAISQLIGKTRKEHGVTSVVVSHSLALAFALGDRIAVVTKGRIRDIGTPDELCDSRDSETREFFQSHSSLQLQGRKHGNTTQG